MIATIEGLRVLVKDASMMRPHLTSRLEKAAFLVVLRPIERLGRDLWQVGSEDGLRFYTVRDGDCECTDYVRHGRGHLCKHRIALFLHRSLEGDVIESIGGDRYDVSRRDGEVPRGFRS